MAKSYRHLFFDLDHTLWDFERNANECLAEIRENLLCNYLSINQLNDFIMAFSAKNKELWDLLEKNLITHEDIRRRRFKESLQPFGIEIDDDLSRKLNAEFLELLPHKTHLIEGTIEVLEYLSPKYHLHILTNGFTDIQAIKMNASGLAFYFKEVITFEKADALKPAKEIFEYALKLANAQKEESLMIGDNYEADILGGMNAGIDTIFYNPAGEAPHNQLVIHKKPTFMIANLLELTIIL